MISATQHFCMSCVKTSKTSNCKASPQDYLLKLVLKIMASFTLYSFSHLSYFNCIAFRSIPILC